MTDERAVVIHIGFPKTATTTIQRHLFRNAEYLSELGVDYCPDVCPIGRFSNAATHYAIAVAYCMPQAIHAQPIPIDLVRERLSGSGQYLLSSEQFSPGNPRQIRAMVEDLDFPENRRVLVTLREEFDYVRSRWMQSVKTGRGFESLWEYYLKRHKPGRRPYSERFKGWDDSGFSVMAIRYEDLRAKSDATKAVLGKLFGLEIDPERWSVVKDANVSPSPHALALYQRVAKPVVELLGSTRAQAIRPKVYKRAHDRFCNNPIVASFSESRDYREQVKRVREDLASLPAIDDLAYESL